MGISAAQVKELREKTGAGMMECKKALTDANGDYEQAIDFLRKQGTLKAAKRSERSTSEGLVAEAVAEDGSGMALVEVNCETDFVARTDQFENFLKDLANYVLTAAPQNLAELLSKKQEVLTELIHKTGENITVNRFLRLTKDGENETLAVYMHPGNKIAVMVKTSCDKKDLDVQVVRDVAMHIAAMYPRYLSADSVPQEVAEKEKAIIKDSDDMKGKSDNVVDKIVEGKYRKFLSEICLLNQIFIKDPDGKRTVEQVLKSYDASLTIKEFARFQVGEAAE
jgi:elongation factor Ts